MTLGIDDERIGQKIDVGLDTGLGIRRIAKNLHRTANGSGSARPVIVLDRICLPRIHFEQFLGEPAFRRRIELFLLFPEYRDSIAHDRSADIDRIVDALCEHLHGLIIGRSQGILPVHILVDTGPRADQPGGVLIDVDHCQCERKRCFLEARGRNLTQCIDQVVVEPEVAIGVAAVGANEIESGVEREICRLPIDAAKILVAEVNQVAVGALIDIRLPDFTAGAVPILDENRLACLECFLAARCVVIRASLLGRQRVVEIRPPQLVWIDLVLSAALDENLLSGVNDRVRRNYRVGSIAIVSDGNRNTHPGLDLLILSLDRRFLQCLRIAPIETSDCFPIHNQVGRPAEEFRRGRDIRACERFSSYCDGVKGTQIRMGRRTGDPVADAGLHEVRIVHDRDGKTTLE